jgi:hypothetical protein
MRYNFCEKSLFIDEKSSQDLCICVKQEKNDSKVVIKSKNSHQNLLNVSAPSQDHERTFCL